MGRGPVGEPAIIKYVNNSLASVDDVSGSDGSMKLIKTLTASDSSSLRFVHGSADVDFSTYPIYVFKFYNIHGSTDGEYTFGFQGSIDAGSNYNVAITSTMIQSYHGESG